MAMTFQKACRKGHPFTPDNLLWSTRDGRMTRRCRTCANLHAAKRRASGTMRQWHGEETPEPEAADRFWRRVHKTQACWIWTGARQPKGYGWIQVNKRMYAAHRMAWAITHGPIPTGLFVCHHCDNPQCVRPDHLFLGTNSENLQDAVRKGRHRPTALPGERNPRAKLTFEDVLEARKEFSRGVTHRELARRFGVARSTMYAAVSGARWKSSGLF